VKKEIKLSGGEISMLKALGLGGSATHGKLLIERMDLAPAEFLDTLNGLITMGYVHSTKVNLARIEDAEHASFRVNASDARDLRDSMRPGGRRDDERHARRRRG
jgi:hypothetical protein